MIMCDMKSLVEYHKKTLVELKENVEKLKRSKVELLKNAQEFSNMAAFAMEQANDTGIRISDSERLIREMEKQAEHYPKDI